MKLKRLGRAELSAMTDTTGERRITWLGLATIWLGGMISVPSFLIGSTLIAGLGFWDAMLSGLIGFCIVAVFMTLLSVSAVDQRMTTVSLASSSFGYNGAKFIVGVVLGISLIGWFGVQAGIAGASFSRILIDTFAIKFSSSASSMFLGCFMMMTAVFGFRYLRYLNYIAVPCKMFLIGYGVWVAFQGKGFDLVVAYQPAAEKRLDMLTAIGLSIGFFSVGGVISPDYAKHAKTRIDAVVGTALGLLPVALCLTATGAMLAILHNTYDIVEIFAKLGMPMMALSVLIIATWTTNVMNAYSAGLALTQTFHLEEKHRSWCTFAAGIVGSALASADILGNFMSFLMLLTVTIPPVAGVIICDYWVTRSFRAEGAKAINWRGLVAWLCGVGAMVGMSSSIKNVLGIAVAALVYAVLVKLAPASVHRVSR